MSDRKKTRYFKQLKEQTIKIEKKKEEKNRKETKTETEKDGMKTRETMQEKQRHKTTLF